MVLRSGFALLALGTGLQMWRFAAQLLPGTPTDLWLDKPKADLLDVESGEFVDHVSRAQFNVAKRYSNPAINVFHSLLTDATRLVRATEHAESDGESLTLATLLDYVLTDSERQDLKNADEESVLIPFMRLKTGTLLDNFDVNDPSGRTVPTLSQHETIGLLAIAVTSLFYLAYKSDDARLRKVRKLTMEEFRAQWRLIHLVCQRGKREPERGPVSDEFDAAVKGLKHTSRKRAAELRTFCEFFGENYLIVAEAPLPPGNHVILKYRKSIPLIGRTRRRRDRMRVWTGLKPRSVTMALTLPFQAPSYHFRISGDSGRFVSSHYLWDISKWKILDQEEIAAKTKPAEDAQGVVSHPYLRVRYRSALPYGHLYARGLHSMEPFDFATVVDFDEVPPGALGRARSVSLASSVLISSFAFVIPAATPNSTNLAALILAAPAFVATWVGHSVERMEKSSLMTYFGLVVTGLISIASAVLYVAQSVASKPHFEHQIVFRGATFPRFDVIWLLLAVASIATTVLLIIQLHNERRRYLDILKRFNTY